jgi:hypothetical protein
MRSRERGLVGVAASLALVGCDLLLGTDEYAIGSGALARPSYASTDCGECVAEQCEDLETDCLEDSVGDDNCALLHGCTAACERNDVRCRGQCLSEHPIARKRFEALDVCRHEQCTAACIGFRGFGTFLGEQCDQCLYESKVCADLSATCAKERNCDWLLSCVATAKTPSPNDVSICVNAEADIDTAYKLLLCMGNCSEACGAGKNWGCVNKFDYGSYPGSGRIPYGLRVYQFGEADPPPVNDVQVQACDTLGCGDSFSVQAGRVALELPLRNSSQFDGHVLFTGATNGVPIITTRFYAGRPITRYEPFLDGTHVVPEALLDGLGPIAQVTGAVGFAAQDCLRQPARGVVFEGNDDWIPFGIPDAFLEAYVNVPPGEHTVRMKDATTDQILGSITITVEARTFTAGFLLPSPKP